MTRAAASASVTALMALQAAVTCLVLAILLYLLIRLPTNVPLRAVTIAVASFSLTVVFGPAATNGTVLLGVEPLMSRLIQLLGMVAGAYSLITFYLFSALDRHEARRQARLQAIPMAATAGLLVAAAVLMPAATRYDAATLAFARPGGPPIDEITIQVLYLTPNVYLVYAFASALLWTRRYSRGAEPRLRRGLALTAVGLTALVAGETLFVTAATAQWAGVLVPLWVFPIGLLFIVPGSVVFMIGFAYPAATTRLAALRVWWQHRRIYHRLAPLWTLLHQHFPEDAFGRVPSSRWGEAVRLRGVHRRYYRRVIECRDGLLRVSPYLGANGNGDSSLAERLRAGLVACAAGVPAPGEAVRVAIPATDGLDADVRELITLSEALRVSDPESRYGRQTAWSAGQR